MANKQVILIPGMAERMRAIRKHLNLSQKDFSRMLNCYRNRISDIERGIRGIPKITLFALCRTLNVNLNWLVLGAGPMFQGEMESLPDQFSEEFAKQIELLQKRMEEKDRFIDEKDARIRLLEKSLDLQT